MPDELDKNIQTIKDGHLPPLNVPPAKSGTNGLKGSQRGGNKGLAPTTYGLHMETAEKKVEQENKP